MMTFSLFFRCQMCPYSAKDASQLTIHLRTHTGDCPFICWYENCSASFKTNSDLKRHTWTHTGEKPHACSFCSYKCSIKGNFFFINCIRWLGIFHVAAFTITANLRSHIIKNHPSKAESFHKCKVCDYSNVSRVLVQKHEKKHSKVLFICELCDYNSKEKSQYLIHKR